MSKSICGLDCAQCELKETCSGCAPMIAESQVTVHARH